MRKFYASVLAVSVLGGCASKPLDPAIVSQAYAPLTCESQAECDNYWARAQVWVSRYSGFRIQTITNNLIQTYGPSNSSADFDTLAYSIERLPSANGKTEISVVARCGNMNTCQNDSVIAKAAFKSFVKQSQ